ncbi:MAG: LytTR family DNA-binding domain-containing protein, partial [Maricaulaceae bacterium]
ISIGSVGGLLANRLLARRCPSWPEPGKWVFSSAAAAAPVVVAVIAVEIWAGGWRPTVANVGVVVFYVLLISLAVTGIQILLVRAQKGAPAADGAAPGRAPFLDRLPSKLKGAQVLAVQAEDHYLRVHTSAGDDLILLRLSDAERELAPLDGLRVHRSWWVARDAVAEVDRAEGRMTLKLKNGLEAPVSRTYARAVREAGWS